MLTLHYATFVRRKTKASDCNYRSPLLGVASLSCPGNLRAPARGSGHIFFFKLTAVFRLFSSNVEDALQSRVGPTLNAGSPYWCMVRKGDLS